MNSHYDVIVVGAGGAGAPLAARLSEDEGRSVLLLEAGKDHQRTEDFPDEILDASTTKALVPGNPADWGFKGNLTPDLQIVVNRGKILGGSTALNGTYCIRARETDFQRWSQHGNDLWRFENVLPYYRKMETDEDYGGTAVHGDSGPIRIHRPKNENEFARGIVAAAKELGIPEETDKNDQLPPGVGAVPTNSPDGIRWNTGIAYINPIRDSRPNLTVQCETFVRRVVFEGTRAVGVEVDDPQGQRQIIKGSEIVLTAGAVKTPHILMVSGIGPEEELTRYGIPVIRNAPGVGKRFSDHPDILVSWRPSHDIANYETWEQIATSINVTSEDSPSPNDIEILFPDKPMGYQLTGAKQQYMGMAGAVLKHPVKTLKGLKGTSFSRYVHQAIHAADSTLMVLLEQPTARGQISLTSGDPSAYPRLDYNYFDNELDLRRVRSAVRLSVDLLHSDAMRSMFKSLTALNAKTLSDDALLNRWIKTNMITGIHMAGSVPFGAPDDPFTTVDQYGRVLGVEGLRVADVSILPDVSSRGPAATAMMMGELIADQMKQGN